MGRDWVCSRVFWGVGLEESVLEDVQNHGIAYQADVNQSDESYMAGTRRITERLWKTLALAR